METARRDDDDGNSPPDPAAGSNREFWEYIGEDGRRVFLNPILFSVDESHSAAFIIYPEAARTYYDATKYYSLTSIIMSHGGNVTDEPGPYTIPIADTNYVSQFGVTTLDNEDWLHDLYTPSFIHDSIQRKKVLNLNDYRLEVSKYEDYDANAILMRKLRWDQLIEIEESSGTDETDTESVVTHGRVAQNGPIEINHTNSDADASLTDQADDDTPPPRLTPNKPKPKKKSTTDNVEQQPAEPADQPEPKPVLTPNNNKSPRSMTEQRIASTKKTLPTKSPRPQLNQSQKQTKFAVNVNPTESDSDSDDSIATVQPKRRRILENNEQCSSKSVLNTTTPESKNSTTKRKKMDQMASASPNQLPQLSSSSNKSPSKSPDDSRQKQNKKRKFLPRAVSPIADTEDPADDSADSLSENDFNFDINYHAQREEERNIVPRQKKKSTSETKFLPPRTSFTLQDDQKILNVIIKNKWYKYVGGNTIWEWMEKKPELNFRRTWQSLNTRYRKSIKRNLHRYNLTQEQRQAFIEGQKAITNGNRPQVRKLPPLPKKKGTD